MPPMNRTLGCETKSISFAVISAALTNLADDAEIVRIQ